MGQAIVYCARCHAQLRGSDFDKGAALKVEHHAYCLKCLPEGVAPPTPARKEAAPAPSRKRGITTVGEIPAIRSERRPKFPVWIAVVGVAVLGVGGFLLFPGESKKLPSIAAAPADAPAAPVPVLPPAEVAAREAHGRLLRAVADKPADLERQQALLEEAAERAVGTSVAPEIPRERERLARRRLDQRAEELADLERRAASSSDDQAVILLKAAYGRHVDAEWTAAIDRLLAARQPAPPPVAAAPAPVAAPVTKPAPPPAEPVFPPGWESALRSAAARDYGAAQNGPDAALVKAVAALQADAYVALARTPKGQKLSLETSGGRRIEGAFVRESAGLLELKEEAGGVEIEIGELSPASLAGLVRTDPKTAAAFCLIEGDAAAAKSLLGADTAAIPARFWAWAEKRRQENEPSPGLYRDAVALLSKPASAADGVARLQSLLRERADDVFVRRNRTTIAARAQGGRDFLLLVEDLHGSGEFHVGKGGKMDACWTLDNDVEAPKQKTTFLEAEFSTLPDTACKAWVYAGGCCQEVLEFIVDGSGLDAARTVKPYLSTLKKTHAMHNGPKQAARWEWMPVPLPRYEKDGAQKLRIFSDQKGFSVAYLCVSATRSGPPTENELRELIRVRGERPKAILQPPKVIPLYVMKMEPTERFFTGVMRDNSLFGITAFEMCVASLDRPVDIALPEQGEIRFTYFLKSASKLSVRIRATRDGTNLPFDVPVPSPVVGQPTEYRIPFSDFKPAYIKGPALAPGELVRMFHFMAEKIDSGLRIDGMSLVEIRK